MAQPIGTTSTFALTSRNARVVPAKLDDPADQLVDTQKSRLVSSLTLLSHGSALRGCTWSCMYHHRSLSPATLVTGA